MLTGSFKEGFAPLPNSTLPEQTITKIANDQINDERLKSYKWREEEFKVYWNFNKFEETSQ